MLTTWTLEKLADEAPFLGAAYYPYALPENRWHVWYAGQGGEDEAERGATLLEAWTTAYAALFVSLIKVVEDHGAYGVR